MTEETWRDAPGFAGLYEVSDLGRVRSVDRAVDRGGVTHQLRGVVLRTAGRPDGRAMIVLSREGKHTKTLVAPLILSAFIAPRPGGMMACHNNGDVGDDRATNLRWDTQRNNLLDQQDHGTNHWRNRTHCPLGHALRAPNLRPADERAGHRACLACERARGRLRAKKWRGVTLQAMADRCLDEILQGEVSGS